MNRTARYGQVFYLAVFLAAGLYTGLLLLTSMLGLQSAQNTLIYACGILFIFRAVFASRAALLRIRGDGEPAAERSRPLSDTLFAIGDVVAVSSLVLTAWVLWTGDHRLNTPVVPFGVGLAGAYLFYLIAIALRLGAKDR